jgi:hypothetical protein
MNEIKQTLQQDADALLKRLQQSRKNGTGVTLSVSDVGVLCEVLSGGGWISVDFQLPKDGQIVESFDQIKYCVFKNGEFFQRYVENDTGHEFDEPVDVTHWKGAEP